MLLLMLTLALALAYLRAAGVLIVQPHSVEQNSSKSLFSTVLPNQGDETTTQTLISLSISVRFSDTGSPLSSPLLTSTSKLPTDDDETRQPTSTD